MDETQPPEANAVALKAQPTPAAVEAVADTSAPELPSPVSDKHAESEPALRADSALTSLPRRRNGKPRSCEPCRKAKAACDHTLPKCRRCIRKSLTAQCTYHPAPMTKISSGINRVGSSKFHSRDRNSSDSMSAATNLLLLLSQQRTPSSDVHNADDSQEYLGPTSYNAVFQESIGSFDPALLGKDEEDPLYQPNTDDRSEIEPELVQTCINALMSFPDQELGERLLERYFSHCDVILHEPSTWYCFRSFWSQWGKTLKGKEKAGLRIMAETIIDPPHVILRSCQTSAQWLESFTGDNLRVVMVGIWLAVFGLAAMTIPEYDALFTDPQSGLGMTKRHYIFKIGTASEACVKLCTQKAFSSEPLIWLLHCAEILQSQYNGDENGYLWRKAGHVATAVTSLGLHREDAMTTNSIPFMVAELRKRTFASVFISDKQLSTFTGRPPRLSQRYSYCQVPLDLTDEEIMAEGDELKQHLGRLDKDGWKRDDKARRTTFQRGYMLMAILRDEVLEVCLGPSAGLSKVRRDELKLRSEVMYDSFPESIRFDIQQPVPLADSKLSRRVMLRLECLLNVFLLERLPVSTAGVQSNMQNLINVSKSIIEHINMLLRHRDRLSNYLYSMTFSLTYFGLPCAGILALELLKQHKYPRQYSYSLPRSEIIQLLSVFVFCLNLVSPDEGNYKICFRMKKVIANSLDRVLEPSASDTGPEELITPGSTGLSILDVDMPTMIGSDSNDPDFMDWLSSVDWSRGPWVDTL